MILKVICVIADNRYIRIMRSIIFLLFVPVFAVGQQTAYQYAKRVDTVAANRTADTSITWQSAPVILTSTTLTVNGVNYTITGTQDFGQDSDDFYWELLTLQGGLYATIKRYPNKALMNVIIQGGEVSLYYYIL